MVIFRTAVTMLLCLAAGCSVNPAGSSRAQQETAPQPGSWFAERPARAIGNVALLLPASGRFERISATIQAGYFAAYFETAAPRPAIRIYDTGDTVEEMLQAYDAAVAGGAQVIAGPLLKRNVEALATMRSPSVPLLALNFLPEGAEHPLLLHQIGLAPEDEARAAAESAVGRGLVRAVALAADGDWGARIVLAFRQRFEELGGTLLDTRTFSEKSGRYGDPIRQLLGVEASKSRYEDLRAELGRSLKYETRRRRDLDVVFVAARADAARMILPVLRFHRALDLPVYGTADIFEEGLGFWGPGSLYLCDAPLALGSKPDLDILLRDADAGMIQDAPYGPRLAGLGYDAFMAGLAIARGDLAPGDSMPGATGHLTMTSDGAVRRSLSCAEVVGGALRPLSGQSGRCGSTCMHSQGTSTALKRP